ncbi:hypothetical protein BCR43DRAFT_499614 [Syncephalastrum racemosum]|uniref:Uncharacterized protein n=1 Tax=Syncephalastrum racemosum TaxID=13706 RepID=A0A1X2GZG9_SYNRA|nr:hypothetical protein BCR43DRAFT_499614 [Syncephalastrum racemosum]
MADSSLDMSTASLLSQHQRSSSSSSSESGSSNINSSNNANDDNDPTDSGGNDNDGNRNGISESQFSTTSDLRTSIASSSLSHSSVPSPPSPSLTAPPRVIPGEQPTALIVPDANPGRDDEEEEGIGEGPIKPLPVLPSDGGGGWYGQLRRLIYTLGHVMFRDNMLPLLLNVVYHGLAARALLARSDEPAQRTIRMPVNNGVNQRVVMSAVHVAADALRALGTMHLALALVPVLALKEKRLNDERNALMVLTAASIGRVWAEARSIYHRGAAWRALREVGSFDTLMLFVSLVALVKSLRR